MIRFEQLPPDQRAVLSLLLRQRKRYEEVASILQVAPEAVHDRAHAALAVLAPAQARLVDASERERIGEYLLGQQSDLDAVATKTYLAGSTPAREWARALAVELVKLASEALPEIPDAQTAPTPAPVPHRDGDLGSSQQGSSPVSRRGGAILLTGIVLVLAVVVAIVLSSGGSSGNGNQAASRRSEQAITSTTQSGSVANGNSKSSGSGSSQVKVEKLAEMKPLSGSGSAKGYAALVSKGSTHAVEIEANGLPSTEGFSYVVWLTGAKGEFAALGRVPNVTSSGHFRVIEALTQAPSSVSGIEITRETGAHPSSPGQIVLKGSFVGA